MVGHIEPVAHILAIAIHRQRQPLEGILHHQRNQLLGKLARTVVVGTVRSQHRQAIGVVVGPHQMIGGRLGGRVRAVRRICCLLGEGRSRWRKAAVDLIGGDVQKAKLASLLFG